MFFTSRAAGGGHNRIDALELESRQRRTVVEPGRDPAVSPDGRTLFFVAPGEGVTLRLFAKDLVTGRVAAITDGSQTEGFPRVAQVPGAVRVLFTRWVDDQNGDGSVDADDTPSLWSVDFDEKVYDGAPPASPRPLTPGEGGEIFVSVAQDWMVYTTGGGQDLEIYALPLDGVIRTQAGAETVLAAARAEDNPALKRLALRTIVATAPSLAPSARYELARDLSERDRFAWQQVVREYSEAGGDEFSQAKAEVGDCG